MFQGAQKKGGVYLNLLLIDNYAKVITGGDKGINFFYCPITGLFLSKILKPYIKRYICYICNFHDSFFKFLRTYFLYHLNAKAIYIPREMKKKKYIQIRALKFGRRPDVLNNASFSHLVFFLISLS